jgi:hypothetical protein
MAWTEARSAVPMARRWGSVSSGQDEWKAWRSALQVASGWRKARSATPMARRWGLVSSGQDEWRAWRSATPEVIR